MAEIFSVTVEEIIKQLNMEIIYAPENISSLVVTENDCNRPGLQLMGFYEYFNAERVQICGNMEFAYLASLDEKTRYERIDALFATKIPLFIVARGHELYPEMVEIAKKYGVPIARTQDSTTAFIAALIGYLNVELAPRITRHGVLIEVYGEGILIVGESGVGKSETAIELVKRGHRLVADDAVEIRKTSNRTLVGSSPDNIRHFLELRGIGIINTRRLFGMGAVKVSEKIDLIVELEPWDSTKIYDRMGVDNEYTTILGIKIPSLTIPIKPGRNLAVILEVAAMNKVIVVDDGNRIFKRVACADGAAHSLLQGFQVVIDLDLLRMLSRCNFQHRQGVFFHVNPPFRSVRSHRSVPPASEPPRRSRKWHQPQKMRYR